MNKLIFRIILVLLCITFHFNALAQNPDSTLAQQYDEVVNQSGTYKIYKNVPKVKMEALWKNTTDSIKQQKLLLSQSLAKQDQSEVRIAELEAEIKEKESGLTNKLDGMGSAFSNSANAILPWVLALLFGAAFVFAVIRTRAAVKEAANRNEVYNQLFEELREHRSKANEREKKLARELQDERNRLAELEGR
jgi:hypothetical protein